VAVILARSHHACSRLFSYQGRMIAARLEAFRPQLGVMHSSMRLLARELVRDVGASSATAVARGRGITCGSPCLMGGLAAYPVRPRRTTASKPAASSKTAPVTTHS